MTGAGYPFPNHTMAPGIIVHTKSFLATSPYQNISFLVNSHSQMLLFLNYSEGQSLVPCVSTDLASACHFIYPIVALAFSCLLEYRKSLMHLYTASIVTVVISGAYIKII
jgi:hypothetical protein